MIVTFPEVEVVVNDPVALKERSQGGNDFDLIEGVNQETSLEKIMAILKDKLPDFDKLICIMGGAGNTGSEEGKLINAVVAEALATIASQEVAKGKKLVVGDGGSKSGVIETVGKAIVQSTNPETGEKAIFGIGICPKEQVIYKGDPDGNIFPVENNHEVIIPVSATSEPDTKVAKAGGYWGGERDQMYRVLNEIARGKESVGLVVNGGGLTVQEVIKNIDAQRSLVILKGTKRAADGIASMKEFLDQNIGMPLPEDIKVLTGVQTLFDKANAEKNKLENQTAEDKLREWTARMEIVDIGSVNLDDQASISQAVTQLVGVLSKFGKQ